MAAPATVPYSQLYLDRESSKARFPLRTGYGQVGRRFRAVANNYAITTLPTMPVFHFDVAIMASNGRPVPARIYKVLVVNMMTNNPAAFTDRGIHDGNRNLWLAHHLNIERGNSVQFTAWANDQRPGQLPPYTIRLTLVARIDIAALTSVLLSGQQSPDPGQRMADFRNMASALMVLNATVQMVGRELYRHDNANRKSIVYHQPQRELDSGVRWLELWIGHYQSVRPSMNRLTINVDTTHGMMYRAGPLVPLVMSFLRLSNTRDLVPSRIRSAHQLEKFLKGLLVIIKRNPTNETRPKRIVGLLMTGARDHRFTDKNGDNVSVAGHYTRTYSRPITLPDIICVLVGTRDSVVPLEVCEVIGGQPYKGTLPPEATSRAVRVGSTRPGPRLSAIRQAHADLQYGQSQFIRSLGMTIDTNPLELQGRIKEPPVVFFGRDQQVAISSSSSFTLPGRRFFKPAMFKRWAILYYADSRENPNSRIVHDFANALIVRMRNLGINNSDGNPNTPFPAPHIVSVTQGCNLKEHMRNIFESMGNQLPHLVIGIMPNPSDVDQIALKRYGDVEAGIATQIMRKDKVLGPAGAADDYMHNVIAKINLKLGGLNWVLHRSRFPWYNARTNSMPTAIIIGADVSHPPPANITAPSICGVVASMHPTLMCYAARSSVQLGGHRVETITGLAELLQPLFEAFRKQNSPIPPDVPQQQRIAMLRQYWPTKLIYYRDGVGENQLSEVTQAERHAILTAMKNAQTKLNEFPDAPKPDITFIVVSKRHHQRFFPTDSNATDRNGNCLPGSVFDEGIAHPVLFDFYLQSQAPILGTGRPAHYVVTHNENPELNSDTLQQLSYDLCYTYQRATRSVSIPAPTYYADVSRISGVSRILPSPGVAKFEGWWPATQPCELRGFSAGEETKFMFPPDYDFSDAGSVASGQPIDNLLQQHQSRFGPMHPRVADRMYFV